MKDILNTLLAITVTWSLVLLALVLSPLWLIYATMMAYDAWLESLFGPDFYSDYRSDMWVEKGGLYDL